MTKSRQNNLEALGIMASMVAHDLNNILTGILGHVSFLRISGGVAVSAEDSVLAIEDGARRAALITQKILEHARGDGPERRQVDLVRVLASAANLFRVSMPDTVSILVDCGEPSVSVMGDEVEIGQVLMNLLVNARDALEEAGGGEIRVELGSGLLQDESFCREKGVVPGSYALLRISDNGNGIPKETLAKIFEPFFTTKLEKGTGLGLAIVQSIVKSHGGSIRVESTVGRGSSFEVFLPLVREDFSAKPRVPSDSQRKSNQSAPTGTEGILIVDDEEAVRLIMHRTLEHLGYVVESASCGAEALQIFEKDPQRFQLAIIDMIMPEMGGEELFRRLRGIRSDVPVLIASGYSSDARTRAILEDGGLGLLRKPFAVEELAQEVRRCLDLFTPH